MLLNVFLVDWCNSIYCQSLCRVTHRRIKIARFRVGGGKGIDCVLVSPFRNAAGSFSVFNCLLAVTKCWIWASCLQPRALSQGSAQGNTLRVERNDIIQLLQRFRVLSKQRVDRSTHKRRVDKCRILPECFIAILNSKLILPLRCKNLRALIQRRPVFRISCNAASTLCFAPVTSPFSSCFSAFLDRLMATRFPAPTETMIGTLALIAVTLAIIAMRSEVSLGDIICSD